LFSLLSGYLLNLSEAGTSEPGTKELSLDRLLMPWLIADAGSHVLKTAVGIV
jgi:hypothetical protein